MPRGVKKENLPSKICVTCGRPFTWRKKWERCWDEVTTCSKSCNNKRRQKGKPEQGDTNASEEVEMHTSRHHQQQQLQQHKQMHSVATLDDEGFDQDDTKLLQSLMAAGKINNVETENEKDDSTSEASSVSHHTTLGDQVMTFPTPCPQCLAPIETRICPANIPHFKDMLLYCTTCDDCGYKSNELKQGGAIPPKGRRIVLQVTTVQDLSRDVVKSGSAGIQIPEIELELEAGGGGQGFYTTVEGLIRTMKMTLQQANPFAGDDVSNSTQRKRFLQVLLTLQDMADGKVLPFTLIMTDPMAGIYIAPKHSGPDSSVNNETVADENISAVDFERSEEQNELLGITGLLSADSEQYSREHLSDPDDIRQAERKARKDAKKAKKAERRAQRQGNGDPDTGKKTCDLCSKHVNVLIRCLHEEGQTDWSMVCGKCWNKVSGGVPDGDANHPHYRYGGLWKNRRAQD
ncbi:zinc finger type ZPR1 domain containing protein [Nitzschia inconspicua]|uniref:Zinc finger type ZPR1 domain containing protein n=1 Tax=Nitzschia inconspicua TaxID=303405 RepID=A0A9K3PQP2_9STRA|nr:zinc finger type ZPR1 domain containing protein [Nitzschia inconspicua]